MGMNTESNITPHKTPLLWKLLFFVSLAFVLVNRILVFGQINIHYIDSDQPFMWAGAVDYAHGIFMEPRFYGQNYNTFFEGLVAVPLIWCGIPVYYALPAATHFIAVFPFLFTAFFLFRKNKITNAVLVLCVPLCLNQAYDIMSSLPRGFAGGVFFCSFFVVSLLHPQNMKWLAMNAVLAVIGFFVNPNSSLVSVPFFVFLFLHHYKLPRFYMICGAALLFFLFLFYAVEGFYLKHPSYVVLGVTPGFGFTHFFTNLLSVNNLFSHVNFFTVRFGSLALIYLLLFGFVFRFWEKKVFYTVVSVFAFVCLTFFLGKMQDGRLWPFYSYSRMYLGLPLLFCFLIVLMPLRPRKLLILACIVSASYGGYKMANLKTAVAFHTRENIWFGVHLVSLHTALEAIDFYGQVCKKNNCDFFLVSNSFWLNTFLDYGGPAVHSDFPETEETNSERRYWVREKNQNKVHGHFVYLSSTFELNQVLPADSSFSMQKLDDYGLWLIKNNTLTTSEFIRRVKAAEAKTQ